MGSNDERCSDDFDLGLDISPEKDYKLRSIIIDDDKDKFVSRINRHKYKADVVPLVHWEWIFEYGALKCAAALLQGETSQTVDFYSSDTFRLPMTHTLARTDNYDFIELFIRHGASFDHRCYGVGQSLWYLEGKLPLNTAVESISALFSRSSIFFEKWNPRKPFFELLVGLSMVIEKKQMDSIRVLVLNTKEAELEICHYAKEGNVIELAVLLMTARKEVALLMSQIRDGSTSNGRISIHQYILSKLEALICEEYKPTSYNEQKKLLLAGKEKKAAFTSVLVLLEFFEMEGDTIEAYIRQERVNLSKEQVALDIAWLLQGAKILPKYRGINLNKIWSRPERRLGFMQPTRYAIRAKELMKKKLKDGEMNENTKVGIEGPEESPKVAISFSSSKMEAIYSKICKSNRVPKNDRGKASNKEINIFPTGWTFMARSFHTIRAASGSQSTSSRDVQAKRTIKPYLK
ncbi:hypothetical protein LOK49_LG12G02023 [Camellia lanceoleosa]|uniref:Uncharacterized protein n=1 Tax=Camellia lanceoleosa TaxID=1840588 RepID=A0ACC0FUS7_9ERIC|nr:hypothetical protein LOK49_LG12G02023 [Camellia lanceoleosa]